MLLGPVRGTTFIPLEWARDTKLVPGSATAGTPASESNPTDSPRINGSNSL